MMAHNEKYKQSVEADELFQEDDSIPNVGSKNIIMQQPVDAEEEPFNREIFQKLNPASTTSSLEPADRASINQVDLNSQGGGDMNKSYHVLSDEIKV